MIYVPDLFSSYVKGEQQAIQDNWTDLKNYEEIERARTQNDAANLELQLAQWGFGNEVAKSDYEGTAARANEAITMAQTPGKIDAGISDSTLERLRRDAILNNERNLGQYANDNIFTRTYAGSVDNAATLAKANVDYNLIPDAATAYSIGKQGQFALNNAQAQAAIQTAPDIFGRAVMDSNTGLTQSRINNIYAQDYLTNQQQLDLDNARASKQLTGAQVADQYQQIQSLPDQRLINDFNAYRAEAARLRQQAQFVQDNNGSQEEVAYYMRAADAAARQADNYSAVAQARNSNARIIGIDDVDTLGLPTGSGHYGVVTPKVSVGSPVYLEQQHRDLLAQQEEAAAAAATASMFNTPTPDLQVENVVAAANGKTPGTPLSTTGYGDGTQQYGARYNPANNNAYQVKKQAAYGVYTPGSTVQMIAPTTGKKVPGTIVGEVVENGVTKIQIKLPGDRTIAVQRGTLNKLTTGQSDKTPETINGPGKAIDIFAGWYTP